MNKGELMKKTTITFAAAVMLASSVTRVSAGDREWATAGKILTGVVAGAVLARTFEPAPVYYHTTTDYAPTPVVVAPLPPPPSVVVRPAPVVVYPSAVYVHSAPVYVAAAPAYVAPAPSFRFHVSFGRRHHVPHVHRICR